MKTDRRSGFYGRRRRFWPGGAAFQNGGTACHSEEWRFTDEEPLPNRRRSGRIQRSGWRKRAVGVQPGGAVFKNRGVVVKWRGIGFDAGAAGFANGTAVFKVGTAGEEFGAAAAGGGSASLHETSCVFPKRTSHETSGFDFEQFGNFFRTFRFGNRAARGSAVAVRAGLGLAMKHVQR